MIELPNFRSFPEMILAYTMEQCVWGSTMTSREMSPMMKWLSSNRENCCTKEVWFVLAQNTMTPTTVFMSSKFIPYFPLIWSAGLACFAESCTNSCASWFAFLIALQWKRWHLLGEKQPKFPILQSKYLSGFSVKFVLFIYFMLQDACSKFLLHFDYFFVFSWMFHYIFTIVALFQSLIPLLLG